MNLCDIVLWRAAIGNFNSSPIRISVLKRRSPLSYVLQVVPLLLLCVFFVLISIFAIPLSVLLLLASQLFPLPQCKLLKIFTVKAVLCIPLSLLLKANYFSIPSATENLYRSFSKAFFSYAYVFIFCEFSNIVFSKWVQSQLILRSNDVEKNPDPVPKVGNYFNFCSWNLSSISAHDFSRLSLLEAFNIIHKFDAIAICETRLHSTIDLPANAVDDDKVALSRYEFIKKNHPDDVKRGGVGLFYKDALPLKQRRDLEVLQECLVCELCYDSKKIFFVVIYRSPSQSREEFDLFLDQFEHLISMIKQENPYSVIITGDFNCRSPLWWPDDIGNVEGELFEPLASSLDLHQLVSEPIHFIGNSKSCIDLIRALYFHGSAEHIY